MSEFDPLSFFDGDVTPAAPVAAPPAAPEPVLEAQPSVPAPAAPEPAPAAPAAPAAEFDGAPAGFVPIGALTAERQKRQTLEEEVRASRSSPTAPSAPPAPAVVPTPGTPEHGAWLQDQQAMIQLDSKMNLSESRAISKFGIETVSAVQAWADSQDEHFFNRLLRADDPYAVAKAEYDKDQAAKAYQDLPQDELTQFREWKAAQAALLAGNPTPAPVSPAAQPVVIAPSVAAAAKEGLPTVTGTGTIMNAPNAGGPKPGDVPVGQGAAFANAFND